VLIAATPEQIREARLRLARVGIEDVPGYLDGGVQGWQDAGLTLQELPQITVEDLSGRLADGVTQVLDVRREGEWDAGHIASADWYPLDRFKAALPPLGRDETIAVHCKSGYRSIIACSLLERAGYNKIMNVTGGFDAWQAAGLPVSSGAAVAV